MEKINVENNDVISKAEDYKNNIISILDKNERSINSIQDEISAAHSEAQKSYDIAEKEIIENTEWSNEPNATVDAQGYLNDSVSDELYNEKFSTVHALENQYNEDLYGYEIWMGELTEQLDAAVRPGDKNTIQDFFKEIEDKNEYYETEINVTTIIEADLERPISMENPANIHIIDSNNDVNFSYPIYYYEEDSDDLTTKFHTFLNDGEDDEIYYLNEIFDKDNLEKIEDAIENDENIHIDNPKNYFGMKNVNQLFEYANQEAEEERTSFDEKLAIEVKPNYQSLKDQLFVYNKNDTIFVNGEKLGEIENNHFEISPYNHESDNPGEVIRNKINNLDSIKMTVPLDDIDLEKLKEHSNHVYTPQNSNSLENSIKSLAIGKSILQIDQKLIDSNYELHSSFEDYYSNKKQLEVNDGFKDYLNNRLEDIFDKKEELENYTTIDPREEKSIYQSNEDAIKSIEQIQPEDIVEDYLPTQIKDEVTTVFNDYKVAAKNQIYNTFEELHENRDKQLFMSANNLKELDTTYIKSLNGDVSSDYYQGFKDALKKSLPYEQTNREKRESDLDNAFTVKEYLENKHGLKTNIDVSQNILSTKDNKLSLSIDNLNKDPENSLENFERNIESTKNMTKNKQTSIDL